MTQAIERCLRNDRFSAAPDGAHVLPPLPYDHAALEPHVDAKTMSIHHDKHHASYVTKLNEALADEPELKARSLNALLRGLDEIPVKIRGAVRNNGGGHLNHSLFWRLMSPDGGGEPGDTLGDAIARDFGDAASFRDEFDALGAKVFGSGWVWLVAEPDGGKLSVVTTGGHDNPIMDGLYPILVNDVWEHAYYLKHQNRRPDYLAGWWSVVNWREAAARSANVARGG